jgi:hypothetical protein
MRPELGAPLRVGRRRVRGGLKPAPVTTVAASSACSCFGLHGSRHGSLDDACMAAVTAPSRFLHGPRDGSCTDHPRLFTAFYGSGFTKTDAAKREVIYSPHFVRPGEGPLHLPTPRPRPEPEAHEP